MPTLESMPRKDLHIFYILDTSSSMKHDGKIEMLNRAMRETLVALQDEAKKNADAKLHMVVLEFNSGARWITAHGPEDLEKDFIWDDLAAGGLTDMGLALKELNSKLSRQSWLGSMTGAFLPILIFMTDGQPTDNYKKQLAEIQENRWFTHAIRIGFAVGDDADTDMIADIVGNIEAVIQTNDLEIFRKLLRFVSVTSSVLRSQPKLNGEVDGATVVKEAQRELEQKADPDWDDKDFY